MGEATKEVIYSTTREMLPMVIWGPGILINPDVCGNRKQTNLRATKCVIVHQNGPPKKRLQIAFLEVCWFSLLVIPCGLLDQPLRWIGCETFRLNRGDTDLAPNTSPWPCSAANSKAKKLAKRSSMPIRLCRTGSYPPPFICLRICVLFIIIIIIIIIIIFPCWF